MKFGHTCSAGQAAAAAGQACRGAAAALPAARTHGAVPAPRKGALFVFYVWYESVWRIGSEHFGPVSVPGKGEQVYSTTLS
jgi:hypothetical protein